jgi:hypothetical protein
LGRCGKAIRLGKGIEPLAAARLAKVRPKARGKRQLILKSGDFSDPYWY